MAVNINLISISNIGNIVDEPPPEPIPSNNPDESDSDDSDSETDNVSEVEEYRERLKYNCNDTYTIKMKLDIWTTPDNTVVIAIIMKRSTLRTGILSIRAYY